MTSSTLLTPSSKPDPVRTSPDRYAPVFTMDRLSSSQRLWPSSQMAPPNVMKCLEGLAGAVMSNVQQFQGNLQRSMQQLGQRAGEAVQQMQQHVAQHLQAPGGHTPLLASVSARLAAGSSALAPGHVQPLFDMAFNPEDLKMRLSEVPVYTVVDSENQFVLVSGEDSKQELGFFFFKESDAQALVDTIKSQNPKLGKHARVMPTSMGNVYEFAITPREAMGLEGVLFRFIPDAEQVERAVQLFRQAGVSQQDFTGVPLFQAEGLTVKSDKHRFTPLFFSKADLDAALRNANLLKDSEAQVDTRRKAEQARADLQAAEAELASAADKERKAAQKKVETSAKRVEKYEQRLEELRREKKQPRVDVGSLEEVIAKMELDEKGEWGDVMFIPPGALAEEAAAPAATAAAKK